jgi:poly-gamma-glutamate capsule biosynthesis protein CapA/YwtB (metallophosphatase superfamily)
MVPLTLSLLQILCRTIRVREGKVPVVASKVTVVASKVVVVKKAVTGKLMHEADSKVLRYIPSLH